MRAAKIAATQRGLSLKDLFTKALAREVSTDVRPPNKGRVRFPLVGSADAPHKVDMSNVDIAEALGNDDAEKYV